MNICDGKKCGQGKWSGGGNYFVCPHNNVTVLRPNWMLEWHPTLNKICQSL